MGLYLSAVNNNIIVDQLVRRGLRCVQEHATDNDDDDEHAFSVPALGGCKFEIYYVFRLRRRLLESCASHTL